VTTITKEARARLRSLFDASTEPEPHKVWIASHRRDCPAVVYTSGPGPCRSVIDVAQCSDADADLIAAARNALPALLDAADRVDVLVSMYEHDAGRLGGRAEAAEQRVAELEAENQRIWSTGNAIAKAADGMRAHEKTQDDLLRAANARIAELEAALKAIAEGDAGHSGAFDWPEFYESIREHARAALAKKGGA